MERVRSDGTVAVPLTSLVLAGGAAISFAAGDAIGFLSDTAEDVFTVTWVLGWVLIGWAGILGGGYAVLLIGRSLARRPVSRREAVLAGTCLALIAIVIAVHPLWGAGSGTGS
jgi:hypothetical protein